MKRPVRFYIPTNSAEDWKGLLAQPEKQWRTRYSAKALAQCWEDAHGFPESVQKVFFDSGFQVFKKLLPLLALPEYQVPLPGGSGPSQNDIFILARSDTDLVTITVEGKVEEPFGPTVNEWLQNASSGKQVRLDAVKERLEIGNQPLNSIRYQLLHRTASALIEARWFNASSAVMLVHSFSQGHKWFEDYNEFLGLFDQSGEPDSVSFVGNKNGIDLYLSWVTGEDKYLAV